MKKLNTMEMRNVEGGAKCEGCGKKKSFLTMWIHKMFCTAYQSYKARKALNRMWG